VEVLSVSPHAIWLQVNGEEHLLRYDDHPWFRDARVAEIFNVELKHGVHLRWPDLDVDLHVDSLREPERFPLVDRRRRRAPR
jgi:hypothetical protein